MGEIGERKLTYYIHLEMFGQDIGSKLKSVTTSLRSVCANVLQGPELLRRCIAHERWTDNSQ